MLQSFGFLLGNVLGIALFRLKYYFQIPTLHLITAVLLRRNSTGTSLIGILCVCVHLCCK